MSKEVTGVAGIVDRALGRTRVTNEDADAAVAVAHAMESCFKALEHTLGGVRLRNPRVELVNSSGFFIGCVTRVNGEWQVEFLAGGSV